MSEILDLHGAKILAVDDVPAVLEVLRRTLEAAGYFILEAPTGERAESLFFAHAPGAFTS